MRIWNKHAPCRQLANALNNIASHTLTPEGNGYVHATTESLVLQLTG